MTQELEKLYNILVEILGESKSGFDEKNFQYQFPCPHCIEKYGQEEARKFNLELNFSLQRMNCWKCSSEGEDMHGSILKLIKNYGNEKLLMEYKETIRSLRQTKLYKLSFKDSDFNIDTSIIEKEELKLPKSFKPFDRNGYNNPRALKYLMERGLTWDIIEEHKIGYTSYEEENKKGSYRIIIPSYNALGELNYWVGRDYLPQGEKSAPWRLKYDNPKVEKKDVIFGEDKIQWDADITLVEGTFDHIVVPNSIPLLGKALNERYKLYWELIEHSDKNKMSNINIWLDDDAKETAKQIYSLLNHGNLYGKIRMVDSSLGKDPSEIFNTYGYKGIVKCLKASRKLEEFMLGV